jgi:hypothetical protein
LNSLTLSVRPSVHYFFAIFQPNLQVLDSKRRLSIYEEYGWVFRSKAGIELRLGPSQIKVFSSYFINFWETIHVFQFISQGYSKIKIFQKKFFLGSIGSSWFFFIIIAQHIVEIDLFRSCKKYYVYRFYSIPSKF